MNESAEHDELVTWLREAERALNRREYRLAHELCLKMLTRRPDSADAFFLGGMPDTIRGASFFSTHMTVGS